MPKALFLPLIASVLLLTPPTAQAEDVPLLAPTKNVAVAYRLSGSSRQRGAEKMEVSWGNQGRARLDFFRFTETKISFLSVIYDPPSDRITTVLPETRGYMQRDVGTLPSPAAFLNSSMTFTRIGKAMIAGLSCTDWRVVHDTYKGTACVTDDGVVLRATRDQPNEGVTEALTVSYEALPDSLFVPPAAFEFIPSPGFPQIKPPPGALIRTPSGSARQDASPPPVAANRPDTASPSDAGKLAAKPSTPAFAPTVKPEPLSAACATAADGAKQAQKPTLLPMCDVAVIYGVEGLDLEGARKLQVTYSKAGQRTRIDYFRWAEANYPFLSLIFDRPADRLIVILPERRAYIERPIETNLNPAVLIKPDMSFARKGTATVAGTPCTEWQLKPVDKPDDSGTACITDFGLILSVTSQSATPAKSSTASMTATVVGYTLPPDSVFGPPAGFRRERAR